MAAGVAEQPFRFQFSAYAIELPSTCSEECTNATLAFRLFDFPSVLLHLQRTPANVEALLVEHSHKRSGVERCRVRGGKSCLFNMSSEQLKYLSETSQLYVMLTRLSPASSGGQDAADVHLLAASTVSLQSLVETCLADATPSKHKHSVSLYRRSQLYAKAHVTLSLQRVPVASEGIGGGGSADAYSRSDGATEQSNRVRRVVGAHQQAEGLSHVVGPPPMLFRACRPKHQPAPQEVCSGVKPSLVSSGDPVPIESCSTTTTGRRTVWPNGYVEEVVCDETVLAAVDQLPTTSEDHITSALEDNTYPILQALLKELSIIKSHSQEVQFQEHHAGVVAPKQSSDKCLQTEECPEVSSPPASGRVQHRANKPSPQRPFVRTCCAMKHVPGEQETAVKKKLRQAKPLHTPLQSKAEVPPANNKHHIAPTEGQPENSDSVQLPASAATPPSEGGVGVVGVPKVVASTPLYTEVPATGCTTKEASSELKRVNSHQSLSPVQEGDSRDDRSGDSHVDRVDRSNNHIDRSDDNHVDRSDSHVDSRVDRSDNHVDRDYRSDSHDDRSDGRGQKSGSHVDSSDEGHNSQGHSSADNTSAGATCTSTHHPSPQIIHSIDSKSSISSGIHPANKHTQVRESSDSVSVAQKVHSGGEQQNESLRPPSSPHVSKHDEVRSSTGYSVDSLEEGRSVDTPTGLSSELRDSYTEDFESGSDFSQDRNPVSSSDWNRGMLYSPVPVDEEGTSASATTTASASSSTVNTTDQ